MCAVPYRSRSLCVSTWNVVSGTKKLRGLFYLILFYLDLQTTWRCHIGQRSTKSIIRKHGHCAWVPPETGTRRSPGNTTGTWLTFVNEWVVFAGSAHQQFYAFTPFAHSPNIDKVFGTALDTRVTRHTLCFRDIYTIVGKAKHKHVSKTNNFSETDSIWKKNKKWRVMGGGWVLMTLCHWDDPQSLCCPSTYQTKLTVKVNGTNFNRK